MLDHVINFEKKILNHCHDVLVAQGQTGDAATELLEHHRKECIEFAREAMRRIIIEDERYEAVGWWEWDGANVLRQVVDKMTGWAQDL